MGTYHATSSPDLQATMARAASGEDPAARLAIGALKDTLAAVLDDIVRVMHDDIGNQG